MWTEIDSAGASSGGGDSVSDSIAMLFSDIIVNQKSYGDEECMTTSYVMTVSCLLCSHTYIYRIHDYSQLYSIFFVPISHVYGYYVMYAGYLCIVGVIHTYFR